LDIWAEHKKSCFQNQVNNIIDEKIAVVLAAGSVPENTLQDLISKMQIPVKTIGDANRITLAFDAVHDGFNAGREID
jgi:6-phosphogluconolactonase/glucosamine-6-phosphate isomerase/deaminase